MQAGQINAAQAMMSFIAGEKNKISRKLADQEFARVLDQQHVKRSGEDNGLKSSADGRLLATRNAGNIQLSEARADSSDSVRRAGSNDDDEKSERPRRAASIRNQARAIQPKVSSELYFANPPLLESALGQLRMSADVRQACEAARDDQGRISMKSLIEVLRQANAGAAGESVPRGAAPAAPTAPAGVPAETVTEVMNSLRQARQGQKPAAVDLESLGLKSTGTYGIDEFRQLLDDVVRHVSDQVVADKVLSPFAKASDPSLDVDSSDAASDGTEFESPARQIVGSIIPSFAGSAGKSEQEFGSPDSQLRGSRANAKDAKAADNAMSARGTTTGGASGGVDGLDGLELQNEQARGGWMEAGDALLSDKASMSAPDKTAAGLSTSGSSVSSGASSGSGSSGSGAFGSSGSSGSNGGHAAAAAETTASSAANATEAGNVYAKPGVQAEAPQPLADNGMLPSAPAGDALRSGMPDISDLIGSQSFMVLTEKGTTASRSYAPEYDDGMDAVTPSGLQSGTDGLKAGSARGGENSSLMDADGDAGQRGRDGLAGFSASAKLPGPGGPGQGGYVRGMEDGFGVLVKGAPDSASGAEGRLVMHGSSWVRDLSEQIKGMAGRNRGHLTLELDPKSMGHMTLRIEANNDQVTAVISAGNDQVKDLLMKNAPELRQHLQDAGLNLSQFQVDVRRDAGDGRAAARQARQDASAGRRGKTGKVQGVEDKARSESSPAYGRYAEDRLISLFA